VADFFRAWEVAVASGIRDINVDLIAGLPGDTFAGFAYSLDTVISLAPSNLTVHTLAVKNAASLRETGYNLYSLTGGDTAKMVEYSQLEAKLAGYRPYYMYRQKNTVANLENVGYSQEGHEGLYNIFMMEELHSIFAVGAGAVTKLIATPEKLGGGRVIQRIFTPKYPYEYLRDAEKLRTGGDIGRPSVAEEIAAFFEKNG
jgi:oxygen-independent coproporphyrinogen-3 oxidase